MSNFWSIYIIIIVLLNIVGCAWLLVWTRHMNPADMAEDGTTGHEYDGIREYNKPLPRWWLMMAWISIVFSIGYLVAYPGFGKYPGVLGWTAQNEVKADQEAYEKKYGAQFTAFAQTPIEQLAGDEKAMRIGARLFGNNCAVCHGTDAKGAQGFPNLTDGDWIYGGEPDQIKTTILGGRHGMMPAKGGNATLTDDDVVNVAHYVRSLSGMKGVDSAKAQAGEPVFQATCSVCHGASGDGNHLMGAPRLNDNIWLYGGSENAVIKTISEGRTGIMPAQKEALGEERVHLLAAYVWSLSHKK